MLKVVSTSPERRFGRVLSSQLAARLCLANTASRTLRALGYRVVREELFPKSGDCPEIEILRDEKPLGPLLDRTQDRLWIDIDGGKRCRATLAGAVVTWWEAQP